MGDPHWHILLAHPRIDRQEVAAVLGQRFPGPRRVQVQPFHPQTLVRENVETACLRNQMSTKILSNGSHIQLICKQHHRARRHRASAVPNGFRMRQILGRDALILRKPFRLADLDALLVQVAAYVSRNNLVPPVLLFWYVTREAEPCRSMANRR